MKLLVDLAERGWLNDGLIRMGIRHLVHKRLLEISQANKSMAQAAKRHFVKEMHRQPIAIETDKANEQHYELPAAFFENVLGRQLKYSSAYWLPDTTSLDEHI